jgi:hypothetical protein
MTMRRVAAALALGMVATLGAVSAPAANANEIGYQGCTPGYWKNHTDSWQEATTASLFSNKFGSADEGPATGQSGWLAGKTFLQTLQAKGGPDLAGAEQILSRAATAAYLNAATEGLGYPWRRSSEGLDGRPPLVPTVRHTLNTGTREDMIALATWLDTDNNLGCPLN